VLVHLLDSIIETWAFFARLGPGLRWSNGRLLG
jgi:hypothetical protein